MSSGADHLLPPGTTQPRCIENVDSHPAHAHPTQPFHLAQMWNLRSFVESLPAHHWTVCCRENYVFHRIHLPWFQ